VTAVEPAGDDGGDEELRAVAVLMSGHVLARYGVSRTYVLGPALAMESMKGFLWASLKFSSANFSP
jgi:hypothetical protein